MIRELKTGLNILDKPSKLNALPLHMQIEIVRGCNLRCVFCGIGMAGKKIRFLSFEDFRKLIDAAQPKKVALSGLGEPFLHPNIIEIIEFSKDRGIDINVTSNFTRILGREEQVVRSGLNCIKISMDSANRETYQRIRGQDKFEQITSAIGDLVACRKRLKRSTPSITVQFVVLKENIDEMVPFIQLAHNLGIDAVYFQPLNLGMVKYDDRGKEYETQLLPPLRYEEMRSRLVHACRFADQLVMPTNLSFLLSNFTYFWKIAQGEELTEDYWRECVLPWMSVFVKVTGEVTPCCSLLSEEAVMGNFLEEDFHCLLNREKYRDFRKTLRKGRYSAYRCVNCIGLAKSDLLHLGRLNGLSPRLLRRFLSRRALDADSPDS